MSAAPDSPVPGLLPYPDTPERRLRRALGALDAALAEQRGAVAAFRAQIGALRQAVGQLNASAQAASRDLLVIAARLEQTAQA